MKVSKKILRIVLIVCIVIGVFLLGSFIKSQHTDKVKQDIRESIEEQEKREQEEKKKQEEQALEEKRKQEEQKRLEEEKKKEEERQKLENQKLNVLQEMSGEWKLSYIVFLNGENPEWIEYKSNDERGWFGVLVDAGVDWLKSKDGFLSKLAGYGGEALLSGNEPKYLYMDTSCVDFSSFGDGKYYFNRSIYEFEYTTDVNKLNYFSWLNENETGIVVIYDDELKRVSALQYLNGQLEDNGYLVFYRK